MWQAMDQYVQVSYGLSYKEETSTTLYENNASYIAQLKGENISSEVFFMHDLQKQGVIDVQQICTSDNLPDSLMKLLPTSSFQKLVHKIGMH